MIILTLLILQNGTHFQQYGGDYVTQAECVSAGWEARKSDYRIVQFKCEVEDGK